MKMKLFCACTNDTCRAQITLSNKADVLELDTGTEDECIHEFILTRADAIRLMKWIGSYGEEIL